MHLKTTSVNRNALGIVFNSPCDANEPQNNKWMSRLKLKAEETAVGREGGRERGESEHGLTSSLP